MNNDKTTVSVGVLGTHSDINVDVEQYVIENPKGVMYGIGFNIVLPIKYWDDDDLPQRELPLHAAHIAAQVFCALDVKGISDVPSLVDNLGDIFVRVKATDEYGATFVMWQHADTDDGFAGIETCPGCGDAYAADGQCENKDCAFSADFEGEPYDPEFDEESEFDNPYEQRYGFGYEDEDDDPWY